MTGSRARRAAGVSLALAGALALAGCVQAPDDGATDGSLELLNELSAGLEAQERVSLGGIGGQGGQNTVGRLGVTTMIGRADIYASCRGTEAAGALRINGTETVALECEPGGSPVWVAFDLEAPTRELLFEVEGLPEGAAWAVFAVEAIEGESAPSR